MMYRVYITSAKGYLLLGGLKSHGASFLDLLEALAWTHTIVEGNLKAGREVATVTIEGPQS